MTSAGGSNASRLRLYGSFIGIGEATPSKPLHLTTSSTGTQVQSECTANDAGSGGDIVLFHRRGASGAGQDADVLSTVFFRGKNDNGTPEELNYCAIEGSISDATDESEDGALKFKVRKLARYRRSLKLMGPPLASLVLRLLCNRRTLQTSPRLLQVDHCQPLTTQHDCKRCRSNECRAVAVLRDA